MIPIFEPYMAGREREYLLECIDTGWISSKGSFIRRFEEGFADYCDARYGVATSNCTTALHLGLVALGVGPDDEVICTDLTFIAPANMIRLCGATPVLVDCEADTWNCDPIEIEKKITEKTRGIIVVHSFGHAARMDEIMSIAERHGLFVFEDVAEAPGGLYKGRKLGSIGTLACFSFFGNKIITCGEGGMIVTDDAALKDRLEVLRDHGMSKERAYVHTDVGFNYRMTNMQAAIGLAQLEQIDRIHEMRKKQEVLFEKHLEAPELLSFRPKSEWCSPVHWMMTITLKKEQLRERLREFLAQEGIDSRQMIYPVHFAEPYMEKYRGISFPNTESISLNSLHLPSSTALKEDQIKYIATTVLDWLRNHA